MTTKQWVFILALAMTAAANGLAVENADKSAGANKELIAAGNNTFALELYAKLQSQEGNLFF
jgi:serine protease inhibitor